MTHMPDFDPGPVVSVEIFKRDVRVHRRGVLHKGNRGVAPKRSNIKTLSRKSRMRLAFIANNTDVVFKTMVTLTYPSHYPSDGKLVKAHLNTFLTWARRVLSHPSYLWFLEFQKRGAPHVHILIDSALSTDKAERVAVYNKVAQRWYGIVGSGDEHHLRAGTRVERIRKPDGAARYALKYAYKCEQKIVPARYRNVGRFWGCSRDVRPTESLVIPIDELSVRSILVDWDYCPDADTLVYQTLFGCAERFRSYSGIQVCLDTTVDDTRHP